MCHHITYVLQAEVHTWHAAPALGARCAGPRPPSPARTRPGELTQRVGLVFLAVFAMAHNSAPITAFSIGRLGVTKGL